MTTKTLWIDTETTGLDATKCAIIQISALVEINGEVVETFNSFLAPHRGAEISDDALKVTGSTLEQINAYERPDVVYTAFVKFLEKYINTYDKNDKFVPAGYNVQFDLSFLRNFFTRNKNPYFGAYIYGSPFDMLYQIGAMRYMGMIPPEDLQYTSLKDAAHYFGLAEFDGHNSLEDIKATRLLAKEIQKEF